MKYNKLAPVLIGMNKEGVVRADFKTKEVHTCCRYGPQRVKKIDKFHTYPQLRNCSLSPCWNQILDVWPYQVLKNWGYTEQTFILEFDDRTYPLKTGQGRWMNVMVDFFIEAILGNMVHCCMH